MTTDWSEYTLLSFGDSFTFGDGLIPTPTKSVFDTDHSYRDKFYTYATTSKSKSYTSILCKKMGFKANLNFGIPAGSNKNSIRLLTEIFEQNPELDFSRTFVLFGITNIYRDSISFTNKNGADIYQAENIYSLAKNLQRKFPIFNDERSVGYAEFFFHEMRMLYEHINVLTTLKHILETHKIKYLIYDIVNTANSESYIADKDVSYNDGLFDLFYHNEIENASRIGINFDNKILRNSSKILSGEKFKHYYNIRRKTEHNQEITFFDSNQIYRGQPIENLNHYINIWAEANFRPKTKKDAFHEYFISHIDNAHWNEKGHEVAAKIIKSWIEDQDYSYLEK